MEPPDPQTAIERADAIYSLLMKLHAGKSAEESAMLNTKLVLALTSHIGGAETLAKIVAEVLEEDS